MISAVKQDAYFLSFTFSQRPIVRLFRHLLFWIFFLVFNLSFSSSLIFRFDGSRLLFYGAAIPFYYLIFYGFKKLRFSLHFQGLQLLALLAILLILTAHVFLILITAIQMQFPAFGHPGLNQMEGFGFISGFSDVGGRVIVWTFLTDLYFIGSVMPAFAVKLIKDFYPRYSTEQDFQMEADLNELAALRGSLGPLLMMNLLSALKSELSFTSEKAAALVDGAESLIRYSLRETANEILPLQTELDAIEKLLYVQTHRFSQRFQSSFSVKGLVLESHKIPSMMLFSLVDLGMEQTAYNNGKPTSLTFEVEVTGSRLQVKLSEFISEAVLDPDQIKSQWMNQLTYLGMRLQRYYDEYFKPQIVQQGKHVTVSFTIPLS